MTTKIPRLILLFLVSLALLSTIGCSALASASLRADLSEALTNSGLEAPEMDCAMSARSRDGSCVFTGDTDQVEAIIIGLSLRPLSTATAEDVQLDFINSSATCLSDLSEGDRAAVNAYGISGRPDSLQLGNGGQFEFLYLFHQPGSDQVCIFISYAYG